MKTYIYGLALGLVTIFSSCSATKNYSDSSYNDYPTSSITYQQFYDDLSPYGQWINNPDYGYVWSPREVGFRPYSSNGHWTYTNYGWTWISNYDWGWAAFHYGRWFYDDFNGWMWVPGSEWAPAWVNWRSNSQYYGWAPLCPSNRNGRYHEIRNDYWSFVPQQYITNTQVNNYYINQQNNSIIINNTTELNKTRVTKNRTQYQEGPSVVEVERVTKTRITPLAIKQSSTPGSTQLANGTLHIYKPLIKKTEVSQNAIPGKVITQKETSGYKVQTLQATQAGNSEVKNIQQQRVPVQNQPGRYQSEVNSNKPELQKGTKELIVNDNTENTNQAIRDIKPIQRQVKNNNEPIILEERRGSQTQNNQNINNPNPVKKTESRSVNNNEIKQYPAEKVRVEDRPVRNFSPSVPNQNIRNENTKPSRRFDEQRNYPSENRRLPENQAPKQQFQPRTQQLQTRPLEDNRSNRTQGNIIKQK